MISHILTGSAVLVLLLATAYSAYAAYRDGLFDVPTDDADIWARGLVSDAERDGDAFDLARGVQILAPTMRRSEWLLYGPLVNEQPAGLSRRDLLIRLAERHREVAAKATQEVTP